MNKVTCITNNAKETYELGVKIAQMLFPGAFVALYGQLGAGKTALARGIGYGLGVKDITSPTFTIIQEHQGVMPIYHIDSYRLTCPEDLTDIGFLDYLKANGVIIMEWPEIVEDILPKGRLNIYIKGYGDDNRSIIITSEDKHYSILLNEVGKGH